MNKSIWYYAVLSNIENETYYNVEKVGWRMDEKDNDTAINLFFLWYKNHRIWNLLIWVKIES